MISLGAGIEETIRAEAEAAYPNECCGFLIGESDNERRADIALSAENGREDSERYHRFEISAEEMMRAEKKARSLGKDVVGFYHSHPDHAAIPSEFDRTHALPFYSYIIVSVLKGKSDAIKSWELGSDDRMFTEETIA
jgi:proteasome lid subunit RPN8/RPN11